jgi:hypothetical protein
VDRHGQLESQLDASSSPKAVESAMAEVTAVARDALAQLSMSIVPSSPTGLT